MNARWDWDTRSNKEAQDETKGSGGDSLPTVRDDDGNINWMATQQQAVSAAEMFMGANLRIRWSENYSAYQSRHFQGSKYTSKKYRGRTSLFRPKTRMAVRRADAAVGSAFFATHDVVQMTPEDDSNPLQRAGAKLQHELMNLRLDRANTDYGIPWFVTVIGAHQDAKIAGICVSKQEWKYAEEVIGYEGFMVVDEETGEEVEELQPITQTAMSRPDVTLFPPEMVLRDPAADWTDQAQNSSYIILKYPMAVGAVKQRIEEGEYNGHPWLPVSDSQLKQATNDNQTNRGVRRSREGKGVDRLDNTNATVDDYETVWVYENFMRIDGIDYQFWSLATNALLSEPRPTRDVYPEQSGRRPIVVGYGQIEAHKNDPQSHVESMQPLQREINDVVNLRLDNVKQNMSPVTKVRRGRNVDISQVQNRSPDSVIMMNELTDVEWDRPPDVSTSAYSEMHNLDTDIDDIAGTFSSGSVSSNRQLNETVGGMQLLHQSANSLGEFDIRVFSETWMEPALRQLANLNAYYENNPDILSIAGRKAGLWQQYVEGLHNADDYLMQNVQLRVDAGMGSSDPMQKIQRFRMAADTIMAVGGPMAQQKINLDAVIEEVFGVLGYKDGMRFFQAGPGMDPAAMMMQQQLQMAMQQIQQLQQQLQDGQADRDNKVLLERMKIAGDLIKEAMKQEQQAQQAALQREDKLLQHTANFRGQAENARQFDATQNQQQRQFDKQQEAQEKARNDNNKQGENRKALV